MKCKVCGKEARRVYCSPACQKLAKFKRESARESARKEEKKKKHEELKCEQCGNTGFIYPDAEGRSLYCHYIQPDGHVCCWHPAEYKISNQPSSRVA